MCLDVFAGMLRSLRVNADRMLSAAREGFINATDLADYLVRRGLPFREAYKVSGQIVARCVAEGRVLENLPLDIYRQYSDRFEEGVYDAVDLAACVSRRISEGGTGPESVREQLKYLDEQVQRIRQSQL